MSSKEIPYGTREGFLKVYEEITNLIVDKVLPQYNMPAEVMAWTREMIDYNVPGGKLNRGLTVVHALHSIRGDALTDEEAKLAAVLGWCIEWLQAFFLVADDIMDASVTRRSQPCWYKLPKVGMVAINDGFLLQAHLFRVLKEYFSTQPYYLLLVELFNETTWQTELGQLLDLTSQPQPGAGEIDLERFTEERYRRIVEYKTAYYSFYLPVACALVLTGHATPPALEASKTILTIMGEYFQVQDDYLDCYADAETLGKIGTDIQDNKCSWLVVQALAKTTPEDKALLKANYGKHDAGCIAVVKDLYLRLGLEEAFKAYEAASYEKLTGLIAELCPKLNLPESVYLALLAKIYKRSK